MKQLRFAFIAVALFAALSAFVTKSSTLDHKFGRTGSNFTFQSVEYIPVDDVTGLQEGQEDSYDCDFSTTVECTFESDEAATLHNGILSIQASSRVPATSQIGIFVAP
jgi:hypothetical protein